MVGSTPIATHLGNAVRKAAGKTRGKCVALRGVLFGFFQYEIECLALKVAGHLDVFFTNDAFKADIDGVAHLDLSGSAPLLPDSPRVHGAAGENRGSFKT